MSGKGAKGLSSGKGAKGTLTGKTGDKKKPVSRSARAGLQFPVGRIHRLLKVGTSRELAVIVVSVALSDGGRVMLLRTELGAVICSRFSSEVTLTTLKAYVWGIVGACDFKRARGCHCSCLHSGHSG